MFSRIVLLHFEKIFLSMRANLNNVLSFDILFNQFPVTSVRFESIKKSLMFSWCPQLPIFSDDIRLPRFLCMTSRKWDRVNRCWWEGCWRGRYSRSC